MTSIRFLFFLALTFFSSLFSTPKVLLVNDTSNWYHWGCTGTTTALKSGIQALGFEIESIPIKITYSLKDVPSFENFDHKKKFERFCRSNPEIILSIQNADAVVISGEGTIHDLRIGPQALLYLAHISKTFFGKHVEIINHSAYPKDDPAIFNFGLEKPLAGKALKHAQGIYKKTYGTLDFIAIREPLSLSEMKKIDVSATLSFDCLPLYIRDHYHSTKTIVEKTLVLAGSVACTEEGAEKLCQYLEKMDRAGFKIKFLIGAAAFPAKDDQEIVNFLKTHCSVSWELVDATSMEQWLDTINNATLFVSGRFHHSIAAFCLNTPFIAINSNTHKIDGICSLLEQPAPLLFSDPHLVHKLWTRTNEVLSNPVIDNEKKRDHLNTLAEKNFDGLKSFRSSLK